MDKQLINQAAQRIGATPLFATDKNQIIAHFNEGRDRCKEKITNVAVFSHGLPGQLALGYQTNPYLNIKNDDIVSFNQGSFIEGVYTVFFSCNTGTNTPQGTSFAQEWVNQTGGTAEAVSDGRTDYSDINGRNRFGRGFEWYEQDKINRKNGINFDIDGSLNYPRPSIDVQWKIFNHI